MKRFSVALLILLIGCTQDMAFPNATKTTVDGEIYLVRQLRPGTYQALPNVTASDAIFVTDAQVWARNIRAIEQVTGCRVSEGTAKHEFTTSIAAVSC